MIPQPRPAREGMHGRDILAYKRALHALGYHPRAFNWTRGRWGPHMTIALRAFQHDAGIHIDGILGPITYDRLYPTIRVDAYDRWLLTHMATHHRRDFVTELDWMLAAHAGIAYAMTRPIPLHAIVYRHTPFATDCSGLITGAAYASCCPDPNGLGYNGQGFTGTILAHATPIRREDLRAGDLIVFGGGTGDHVVAVHTMAPDPIVFSHGHQGAPDDPRRYPLSAFLDYFAGAPVRYRSLI